MRHRSTGPRKAQPTATAAARFPGDERRATSEKLVQPGKTQCKRVHGKFAGPAHGLRKRPIRVVSTSVILDAKVGSRSFFHSDLTIGPNNLEKISCRPG
jgi:hypothetical protein